jgi:hypothetical protein
MNTFPYYMQGYWQLKVYYKEDGHISLVEYIYVDRYFSFLNKNIKKYETYNKNPKNPTGFDSVKRVDVKSFLRVF